MDIYENRRAWFRAWVETLLPGGRPSFEKTFEYARAQVTQFLSTEYNEGRSIGDVAARRIEKKLGMPDRIMDFPFPDGPIQHTPDELTNYYLMQKGGQERQEESSGPRPVDVLSSTESALPVKLQAQVLLEVLTEEEAALVHKFRMSTPQGKRLIADMADGVEKEELAIVHDQAKLK